MLNNGSKSNAVCAVAYSAGWHLTQNERWIILNKSVEWAVCETGSQV